MKHQKTKYQLLIILLANLLILLLMPMVNGDSPYVLEWGTHGTGDGEFDAPYAVEINQDDLVYVVDRDNNRIQVFDNNGNYISQFGVFGRDAGQLFRPMDIAFDSIGNIYVADGQNHRIQVFDSSHNFLYTWGESGYDDGQFLFPRNIAIDSNDCVYVADSKNNRIQVFDRDGNFLRKWGSEGTGDGEFNSPRNLAIDALDQVYVSDRNNQRIQVFNRDGTFLRKWGGIEGKGDGEFNWPRGIAFDSFGHVFVADSDNNRIQVFDSNGEFQGKWGSYGDGFEEMYYPIEVDVDSSGYVYVTDRGNNRIQKYKIYGVSVECVSPPQSIPVEEETTLQFRVSNTGYVEDTFSVYYSGMLDAVLSPEQVVLESGTSLLVDLNLVGSPHGTGHMIRVEAVSNNAANSGLQVSDSASLMVDVVSTIPVNVDAQEGGSLSLSIPFRLNGAVYETPESFNLDPGLTRFGAMCRVRPGGQVLCFSHWQKNGVFYSSNRLISSDIQESTDLTMVYTPPSFKVRIDAEDSHGNPVPGAAVYLDEDQVGVTYSNGSYIVRSVSLGGHKFAIDSDQHNLWCTRMFIQSDAVITATLEEKPVISVMIETDTGHVVEEKPFWLDGQPKTVSCVESVDQGRHILLAKGYLRINRRLYTFSHWEDESGEILAKTRFKRVFLQEDTLIVAVYDPTV